MSVESVFSNTAATYDGARRRLIPCFDRFYGTALELMPSSAEAVVELGAGTGLFSAMLRERMPEAHLHLMDVSEPMLRQAQDRLREYTRVTTEVADYTLATLPPRQDVVASALSIHHLEHPAKKDLFARVLGALRPGGVFVNADQVAGPTEALEGLYVTRWLRAVRACGATETEIQESLYRQQEDRRAGVEEQLQWMRDAGFAAVDCWFKDGSFAVFTGCKA